MHCSQTLAAAGWPPRHLRAAGDASIGFLSLSRPRLPTEEARGQRQLTTGGLSEVKLGYKRQRYQNQSGNRCLRAPGSEATLYQSLLLRRGFCGLVETGAVTFGRCWLYFFRSHSRGLRLGLLGFAWKRSLLGGSVIRRQWASRSAC